MFDFSPLSQLARQLTMGGVFSIIFSGLRMIFEFQKRKLGYKKIE